MWKATPAKPRKRCPSSPPRNQLVLLFLVAVVGCRTMPLPLCRSKIKACSQMNLHLHGPTGFRWAKRHKIPCPRFKRPLPADDASPKPLDSLFPMPKHQNPFEGTLSRPDFGLISTDSLLNPMRTTYSDDGVGFDSASKLHDRQPQHHHPLRHFIDDWPKSQSELPSVAWPKIDEMKSDRTQLSISIPSDISSSSSSPNQEKLALSPLRLSREFNPVSEGTNASRVGYRYLGSLP
ncbi:growth-regulating factor 6-like [Iris pallida]|uniref:Growth-regulating factor 6-like n=1 Tax=Iris pallida TaxID=29817 RepID=A0AAX6FT86_IRIPA|nr:growth-regulating factor 6-like [Iris pallida]